MADADTDAIRAKLNRNKLQGERGADGHWLVRLPVTVADRRLVDMVLETDRR